MAKLPMMNAKPMGPKPMGLGRGKPGAPTQNAAGAMDFKRPGEMDEKSMMERFAAMGRGKPRAPTQNAAGAMGQRRPRSAAMIGRMARQGMPAPGALAKARPPASKPAVMPSRATITPARSRGAPGGPGYSSTPNYMPSAAEIARNKREGAARVNAMSPMDRLSQNAPKFKG